MNNDIDYSGIDKWHREKYPEYYEWLRTHPRLKYDGKIHKLRGFCRINSEDNGDMYVEESCSCGGCFNRKWKIEENDVVIAFRSIGLNGHLRKIKVIAMKFITGDNVVLDQVKLESHQPAIDFYCGDQLYDNYGIDGGKSFAQELIKEFKKDGTQINSCIKLPHAAKENNEKKL